MSTYLLRRVLTGHMYVHSPYETSSDCGNCDGARCDKCKELWEVENYETEEVKRFQTKGEAMEYMDKIKEEANGIHEN